MQMREGERDTHTTHTHIHRKESFLTGRSARSLSLEKAVRGVVDSGRRSDDAWAAGARRGLIKPRYSRATLGQRGLCRCPRLSVEEGTRRAVSDSRIVNRCARRQEQGRRESPRLSAPFQFVLDVNVVARRREARRTVRPTTGVAKHGKRGTRGMKAGIPAQ